MPTAKHYKKYLYARCSDDFKVAVTNAARETGQSEANLVIMAVSLYLDKLAAEVIAREAAEADAPKRLRVHADEVAAA